MALGSLSSGIGAQAPVAAGPQNGQYADLGNAAGGSVSRINPIVVGLIVVVAVLLLATGVIGLRAAGEVVI